MIPSNALKTVLNLRMLGIAIFPLATIATAVLERSVLMVAGLAVGMIISSTLERRRIPELRAMTTPAMLFSGAAVRFGLLAGLFVICLGIFALFRDTALARSIGLIDLAIFAIATGISIGANEISARIAKSELSAAAPGMSAAFGRGPGGADPSSDGDIIEGELSDPDERP